MSPTQKTGRGSLRALPRYLQKRYGKGRPVLLVHGRSSFGASGAEQIINAATEVRWRHFDQITPNPDVDSIQKGAALLRETEPSAIVAIGGGSVIDTAKGMIAFAAGASVGEILAGDFEIPRDRPELIVAPTTAGSGSEATHFAVVYQEGAKYSLADSALLPDLVYLDTELLVSCPRALALASGADAVCQCVESWWNRNATPDSRALAEKGLSLLIPAYFRGPVEQMLMGANLSGQAINITKTTGGHALSYSLTSKLDLPHGFAVLSVMQQLVRLMEKEHDYFDEASPLDQLFRSYGARFAKGFDSFCEAVWEAHPIESYFDQAEPPSPEALARTVNLERLGNHPVALTQEEIAGVYEAIYARHRSGSAE